MHRCILAFSLVLVLIMSEIRCLQGTRDTWFFICLYTDYNMTGFLLSEVVQFEFYSMAFQPFCFFYTD